MVEKPFPCEIEGPSIVFLGNFNPSIFQPSWLARHHLVAAEEADKADIEIIHPEISIFSIGLQRIVVRLERFEMTTTTPLGADTLRDLALGIFRILDETPLSQMGINRAMQMPTEAEWHAVGHRLVPKKIWEGLLEQPGTRSVSVQGTRLGSSARFLRIIIEPSVQIQNGVFVSTNEHFEIKKDEPFSLLIEQLASHWDEAQRYAKDLAYKLISRCLEEAT